MLIVAKYTNIDKEKWTNLLQQSSTGTWFQSREAYLFYASLPELFFPFAYGLVHDGQLRGVCVGYVTRENNALKQWFTRRAIIVGGPVMADDCTNEEAERLISAVREELQTRAIYIETRNFNDYSCWKPAFEKAGFAYEPHLNFHIDCTNRVEMDARMSDVRRRQLKKAIKSGVTIKEDGISETEIRDYYEILSQLYRKKVKTPLFPWEFFRTFYRNGVGKYLLVQYEGKVIGGIMCVLLDGRTIYEWYICGLDNDYKEQYPSVMATYAAMDYAASNGLQRFDVMGAGKPGVPYGVRDFKSEFGGQMVEHGRFVSVQKPILYRLGSFVVKWMKKLQ